MLGRVARKERFTALDIANEVTANDPHRTADDLRLASDTVHRLFKDGMLTPLGYQESGGTFAPISSSGSLIRRMGRERSDASPVISVTNGWPASRPASSPRRRWRWKPRRRLRGLPGSRRIY